MTNAPAATLAAVLKPEHLAFADHVIAGKSALEAYKLVYPVKSIHAAQTSGSRLMKNVVIAAYIAEAQRIAMERSALTRERWLRELAALAYGTLDDVMPWDEEGPRALIPSADLGQDAKALVQSMEVKRERQYRGKGEDAEPWEVQHIKVKLNSKQSALDTLGKAMGWLQPEVAVVIDASGAHIGPEWHIDYAALSDEELAVLDRIMPPLPTE